MNLANSATSRLVQTTFNLPHESFLSQCNNVITLLKSSKTTSQVSQVHAFLVKTGLDHDLFLTSKLLASSICDARYAASIFNATRNPNLFMVNTMLRAYSISDEPRRAFGIFKDLRGKGIELDQFTFVSVLKACAREMAVEAGQIVHGVVLRSGYLVFVNVKNSLLSVYGICGRIADARKVFDEMPEWNDLVSWNTMMGGYLQASRPAVCVQLFKKLVGCGSVVSATTMLCVLSAFGELGDLSCGGGAVHGYCIKAGFSSELHLNVVTAFTEMYAKTGQIELGRRIFDGVVEKDVVLWNCMIDNYAKVGLVEKAAALLQLMRVKRVKSNSSTLVGLLSACAASGSIKLVQFLNDYVEEEGLVLDAVLGTALVDTFAKCGSLDKAVNIFERMKSKDVKSWTAMILSYGIHGQARNAVSLFDRMEKEGFRPNEVTFLALLSACSHGGLVSEAMDYLKKMVLVYGFTPKIEHYGCITDLLGRAGLLEEAYHLIKSLPIKSDAVTWRALLAACRIYGNIELAECLRRELAEMDDEHPADSLLLSGTYTIAGRLPHDTRWQEAVEEKIYADTGSRTLPEKESVVKESGRSVIKVESHWIKNFLK